MCSPGCFDYWSRLLALAAARPDDVRLSRRGFLAASAVPFVAAACATARAPSGPTRDLLDATLSFDLHSHPGLFKRLSAATPSACSAASARARRPVPAAEGLVVGGGLLGAFLARVPDERGVAVEDVGELPVG